MRLSRDIIRSCHWLGYVYYKQGLEDSLSIGLELDGMSIGNGGFLLLPLQFCVRTYGRCRWYYVLCKTGISKYRARLSLDEATSKLTVATPQELITMLVWWIVRSTYCKQQRTRSLNQHATLIFTHLYFLPPLDPGQCFGLTHVVHMQPSRTTTGFFLGGKKKGETKSVSVCIWSWGGAAVGVHCTCVST